MGSFVVMFRIEEAKVEVDSKKNLWLQSPSGAGLVGSLGGAGNGLCDMPLGSQAVADGRNDGCSRCLFKKKQPFQPA